jgi:hypothetical protein
MKVQQDDTLKIIFSKNKIREVLNIQAENGRISHLMDLENLNP